MEYLVLVRRAPCEGHFQRKDTLTHLNAVSGPQNPSQQHWTQFCLIQCLPNPLSVQFGQPSSRSSMVFDKLNNADSKVLPEHLYSIFPLKEHLSAKRKRESDICLRISPDSSCSKYCPGTNLESMLPLSFLAPASAAAPGIIVVIARKRQ